MPEKSNRIYIALKKLGLHQYRTQAYLGTNAKGSASNLVCLFKKIDVAIPEKALELKVDRGLFWRSLIWKLSP